MTSGSAHRARLALYGRVAVGSSFSPLISPSLGVVEGCSSANEACKGNGVGRVVISSREREWAECS